MVCVYVFFPKNERRNQFGPKSDRHSFGWMVAQSDSSIVYVTTILVLDATTAPAVATVRTVHLHDGRCEAEYAGLVAHSR